MMLPVIEIVGYFNSVVLGLTPLQRWEALKTYRHNPMGNPWLTTAGIAAIVLLAALFFIIRLNRIKREKTSTLRLFDDAAQSAGLTDRESEILWNLARTEGLKRFEFIFTLPTAFDRGAGRLVQEALAEQGVEPSRQLQMELSLLREKLGFYKPAIPQELSAADPGQMSSRQIPVKKKIYVRLPDAPAVSDDLEAVVIGNDVDALQIAFESPIEIVFGQVWRCRYYSGAWVGEFETTVSRCSGDVVALNHSDRVRRINRRRFLRVPIRSSAYVARFPFTKVISEGDRRRWKKNAVLETLPEAVLEPPVFVPATVTELGGPGLRIETALEAAVGDRVLLVFKLSDTLPAEKGFYRRCPEEIVEDLAAVRHVTADQNGFSIALELTALSDEGLEKLVRAANEASIGRTKMIPIDSASGHRQERRPEAVGV